MTNSGLGWAAPLKQPEVDKSLDFKQKPYQDLTQAMGESIKDSIKAQQELTKHLLNNVDTGEKRRQENLDFLFNLAPKALGQAVETANYIREGEKDWGSYTRQDPSSMDEDQLRNSIARDKAFEAINKDASIILEKAGYDKGALDFLNVNNRKERKEILSLYLHTIKTSMYETAGNLEFKIEGKTYTLNGDKTPAWVKKEIRRRLLVSLATNINRTLDADGKKLFSKGEILNGLIRPVSAENHQLFLEESQEEAKQDKIDLLVERHNDLALGINRNDPNALTDYFKTFQETNPDSKLSFAQFIESTWDDLLLLAERGPEHGGVDLDSLIFIWESPYTWNDGTQYSSMREAFETRFPEKGKAIDAQLIKLKGAKIEQEEDKLKVRLHTFVNTWTEKFLNVENREDDQALVQQVNSELLSFKNEFPNHNIDELLSSNFSGIIKAGGIINKEAPTYELLLQAWRDPFRAPTLQEIEQLSPYHQQLFLNATKGDHLSPFNKLQTARIIKFFESQGIMKPEVLDTALAISGVNQLSDYDKLHLSREVLNLVAIEYNKLDVSKYENKGGPAAMLEEAMTRVNENHVELINNALDRKATKEDKNALKAKITQMLAPGYGNRNSVTEQRRLIAGINKYEQTVLRYNNFDRNVAQFRSPERLIGETHVELTMLNEWVLSGGKTKIPGLYKSFSKASGIPVNSIMYLRALGLKNDLISNGDEEIPKEVLDGFNLKLEELNANLNNDSDYLQKLSMAKSNIEANQTLLYPGESNVLDALYHPRAIIKETDQEGFSRYNFIQTTGEETPNNISELSVGELGDLFKKGEYYNIGAYGIANERTFALITIRLIDKGLIKEDESNIFDKDLQKLYLKEALEMQSNLGHQYSGVSFKSSTFSKEDLEACNLQEQFFPLNKKLAEFCKANNYK